MYDTSGAKCVLFRNTANFPKGNICYEELGVYRKKTGEFFLYTFRGTKGDIQPLTFEEAELYIRTNGTVEEYNNVFKPITNSNGTADIRIVVPKEIKTKFDIICSRLGISKTEFIINIINNYYNGG